MQPAEYSALAAVEDKMWYFRSLHRLIERELSRVVGAGPAAVLDAGCGTGGLIRRLTGPHPQWRWTGIDISPAACQWARGRTSADIREASVESMPFAEGGFDAVVLADVLYHLGDDLGALRECRRVLRPGGVVIATVPAYPWLWSYHDAAVDGKRRYSRSGIRERLAGAGFGQVRSTYWNALALPFVVLRRKVLPAPRSGSDVKAYAPVFEALGRGLSAAEAAWLRAFGRLPFGVSILAVGR
jgi:SAM-dependent methyltransferase